MTLLAIGSAVTGLITQNQVVKATNQSNERQRDSAIVGMNDNLSQIEVAKAQESTQAGQKLFANNLEAQKAMSTAQVQAGEQGIGGFSVNALLAEMDGNRSRYNDSVTANLTDKVGALNTQRLSVRNGAASQVNALKEAAPVDYLGAALKIGGATYQHYNPKKG
jgi:DNA-binding transcriptional regulator YiaG